MTRLILVWLTLLALLGVQAAGAAYHAGWLGWACAPLMLGLVAVAFMHAAQASALSRIFGLAGLFWVAVLLMLGSVDYLARRDTPAVVRTVE